MIKAICLLVLVQGCYTHTSMPNDGGVDDLEVSGDLKYTHDLLSTLDLSPLPDLTPLPDLGGMLMASSAEPNATIDLSNEGTLDWLHCGYVWNDDLDLMTDRKSGANFISSVGIVGNAPFHQYSNSVVDYSWDDGSPHNTSTGTHNGLFILGVGNGFSITAPADQSIKTLRVYLSSYSADLKMTAHLSDNSAFDFNDVVVNAKGSIYRVYTFTYKSLSDNATIEITWVNANSYFGGSNITIEAVSLTQ